MSKDCLVSDLVTSVNNDNAFFLGAVTFDVKLPQGQSSGFLNFELGTPENIPVCFDNDVDSFKSGSTINLYNGYVSPYNAIRVNGTVTRKTRFEFLNNSLYGIWKILDKDDNTCKIKVFNTHSLFKYSPITNVKLGNQNNKIEFDKEINISEIGNAESLTQFWLADYPIKGDLSGFSNSKLITALVLFGTADTITGDISSLSKCKSLTTLAIQRRASLRGSVENFVKGQCTEQDAQNPSRTSGTLTVDVRYTNITFQNVGTDNMSLKIIFSGTGATVYDSNNNPIKVYIKSDNQWVDPE